MASSLLEAFEDRRIEIPEASDIRDDLRKPEKLTTPSGRVSIAATRTEAGHADHFWALALAIRAASSDGGPAVAETLGSRERSGERRDDRPHVGSQRGVLV
jgi:phage FluMu gp28-like protein